uniref:Uncharacterized protein n=1 Tax=Candidatus Nitrotoga fabula TaxID=2182327 RepID=A0A2X0REK7_9PROT|nr:protein of unknown function [Candidatus Nitrotoga fabula]
MMFLSVKFNNQVFEFYSELVKDALLIMKGRLSICSEM